MADVLVVHDETTTVVVDVCAEAPAEQFIDYSAPPMPPATGGGGRYNSYNPGGWGN